VELAARLACPACHSSLRTTRQGLACSGCPRAYSVSAGGVPDLLLPEVLPEQQRRNIAEWEEEAAAYLALVAGISAKRVAPIDRPLLAIAAGDVVEVGCGDGRLLAQVAGGRVRSRVGIEPAQPLAAAASARGLDVVRGSAEALPLPDASVDSLLSGYYALRNADLDAALAEAARVLRPGGRLGFTLLGRRAARMGGLAASLPLLFDRRRRWLAAQFVVQLGASATLPNDVDDAEQLRHRLGRQGLEVDELLGTPYVPLLTAAVTRFLPGHLPYLRGAAAARLGFDVIVLAHRV
jgi:SAM-dependent methyltransferase